MADFEIKERYDLSDFRRIIEVLRAPGGCPWDAAQTHESIRRNVIEEAYELAQAIEGKIYIYNFPDRTGYDVSPNLIRDLAAKHKNSVGVKDTVGGVDHTREIIKAVRPVRPDFIVYSGFDDNFAHNVLCGGNGCISGLSNLFPELFAAWVKAMKNDDMKFSAACQKMVDSLMDIYNVGFPFVPAIKEGLVQKGILRYSTPSKPMKALDGEQKKALAGLMARYQGVEALV